MIDRHNGNGWFASWRVCGGFCLVAFRPFSWRLCVVRPQHKPGYTRLYLGPIELERSARTHSKGAE
jgi:hypothetical protein